MTRRDVLKSSVSGLALLPFAWLGGSHRRSEYPTTYGYVDGDNCLRVTGRSSSDARVFLNGRDVTTNVQRLNDRDGWVEVFDERDGKKYANALGQLARRRDFGAVELRFVSLNGQGG